MVDNVESEVSYTAVLLDERQPGWADTLVEEYGPDLGGMYVSDGGRCVLSAIYGSYSVGCAMLGIDRATPGTTLMYLMAATACRYGEDEYYRSVWLREVQERATCQLTAA